MKKLIVAAVLAVFTLPVVFASTPQTTGTDQSTQTHAKKKKEKKQKTNKKGQAPQS